MCEHDELVFLGYQNTVHPGKKLALYNCTICKTTLAFSDINKASPKNVNVKKKHLIK